MCSQESSKYANSSRIKLATEPIHIFILLSFIFIAGCNSSPRYHTSSNVNINNEQDHSKLIVEDLTKVKKEIDFLDIDTFDVELSLALRNQTDEVTVRVLAPFTTNEIPERFRKWIYAIKDNNGKVELEPDPKFKTRFVGVVIDLVVQVYVITKKFLIYRTASDYNLVIYYKEGTGAITQAVFVRKNIEQNEDISVNQSDNATSLKRTDRDENK